MKTIKFMKDCNFNDKSYFKGDALDDFSDLKAIWKLNEKGLIEPLTLKEFLELEKEVKNKNKFKKEEID